MPLSVFYGKMIERESVNVWFDRPGNFLEIFWGYDDGSGVDYPADTELEPTVFLNGENAAVGFHIFGALNDRRDYVEETYTLNDAQPYPLAVKYDRAKDRWEVHWGHPAVDCIDTPNPRIKARVDAAGLIQGVEIYDLRGFSEEILNQDLYPVKPGAPAARQ